MDKRIILEERTHLGQHHMMRGPILEREGDLITSWLDETSLGIGKNITMRLVITDDKKLVEAKITDVATKLTIKIDQHGNLQMDSYNHTPGNDIRAKAYEGDFKRLAKRLNIKTEMPRGEELFKPLASIKTHETVEFSEVVDIRGRRQKFVPIPPKIDEMFSLKDNMLAYWKIYGENIMLNIIAGWHENVSEVWSGGYSLRIVIPRAIQKSYHFENGMNFKIERKSDEVGKFFQLEKTEGEGDVKIYGKEGNFRMSFSQSALRKGIQEYLLLEWDVGKDHISWRILGVHPYAIQLWEKGGLLLATIPKRLRKEMPAFNECSETEWIAMHNRMILRPIVNEEE